MVYKLATNSTEQSVFILILGMKRPASKTQLELSKPAHGWAPGKLLRVSAIRKKKKYQSAGARLLLQEIPTCLFSKIKHPQNSKLVA